MTEHGASIFVFFFLGEYSSLILMSSFMVVFFLGGYHCPDFHNLILDPLIMIYYYLMESLSPYICQLYDYNVGFISNNISYIKKDSRLILPNSYMEFGNYMTNIHIKDTVYNFINILIDKMYGAYVLGVKIIIVVFFYIWIRASFPRLRYDQLMALCWKELLPLVFAYLIFSIYLFYTFDMVPFGIKF